MDDADYAVFQEMFVTDGWKQLKEDLENMAHVYNDVQTTNSLESLYERRGKLEIIAMLLNLEETAELNRNLEGSNLEWWADDNR